MSSPTRKGGIMRTASCESVRLAHPTPDLQSLQGAYVQNVERLEQRAERMSIGSDLGDEIRKLHEEQKLSDSRRSSILSNEPDQQQRPRDVSTGSFSFTNSIVEVNTAARYGGYSPGGYIGSPIGSLRSGSWSQVSHSASISQTRSISKGSKLGLMNGPDFGHEIETSPTDDPTIHAFAPQQQTSRVSSTHSSFSNVSRRQAKRASRLPSDGSFTNLYNQLTEANQSATHLAAARIPSDTSFTDIYEQIAGEIREHLDSPHNDGQSPIGTSSIQQTPVDERPPQLDQFPNNSDDNTPPHRSRPSVAMRTSNSSELVSSSRQSDGDQSRAYGENELPHNPYDAHDRPPTAASTDTYTQAQTLFRDFDGAHYAPSIRESIMEEDLEAEDDDEASAMLRVLPEQRASRLPPPEDGMVYYPAPVPRMLNLPQKISNRPSAADQAQRRTQMLNVIPSEVRKSAPWLHKARRDSDGALSDSGNLRASKMNLAALPPQLRASMFFEHAAQRQEVEVKDGSAMTTFEDMLDASAKAPVSAFTDHPIVGKMGAGVYKKEAAARNSDSLMPGGKEKKEEKRRSSFLGLRRSSISSANALDTDTAKAGKLQKTHSRNVSNALSESALSRGPDSEILGGHSSGATTPLHLSQILGEAVDETALDDEGNSDEGLENDEEPPVEESDEEYFGPPTTLLAELQMRKKEQRSRNRNAFTSFPNGMHSTLLEMDAVAQLQKQKKTKTRVALAWEDPGIHAAKDAVEDDEDVPLGMLFKQNPKVQNQLRERGLADWDRPLGLIERRQMEDNEPLSSRRNRLLGIKPNAIRPAPSVHVSSAVDDADAGAESEHEGETLGERLRRIKEKKRLDEAIGTDSRPISAAFSTELLGELGIEEEGENKTSEGQPKSGNSSQVPDRTQSLTPAEETLGQRRLRLKREATENATRQSQMSLPVEQNRNKLYHSPTMANDGFASQPTRPPLRASLSMADLLAAHPVGQNQPRKVSNEMLVSLLPPGSLLQQNEERTQDRRSHLQATTRRSSGLMLGDHKPFVDGFEERPQAERKRSGGFKGGIYNTGTGGMIMDTNANPQMNGYPYMNQMPAYRNDMMGMGMGMNMGIPGYTPIGMDPTGFAMSSPNLVNGMQSYPQMGMNAGMGMMGMNSMGVGMNGYGTMSHPNLINGFGTMSNPNLLAGMNNGYGMQQAPRSQNGLNMPYQRQSTMSAMPSAPLMQDAPIDPKTRDRVDAWRQSVMP